MAVTQSLPKSPNRVNSRTPFMGMSMVGTTRKEDHMSGTDKAKDKLQAAKGHVKEAAGKATNDRSLEAKGKGDKASGNLKQAGEKVKDAFKK
jgi:uncharacterized protein YjbJ (UPF0337 family)